MKRTILCSFIVFCIIFSSFAIQSIQASQASGSADHQTINMLADNDESFNNRQDKIVSQLNAVYNNAPPAIAEKSSVSAPYAAGKLTDAYLQNALSALNLGRYLSGLPSVTMNVGYNNWAQHAAVLLYATKEVSHAPSKPADMGTDFYNLALKGASDNVAVHDGGDGSFMSLASMVIKGWLADSDGENAWHVGHRQHILSPHISTVGFGQVFALPSYYAMYTFDRTAVPPDYEAIGYPSGNAFPSNIFTVSDVWSVMLNPKYYQTPDINEVVVTVEGAGKTSQLSKNTKNVTGTNVWGEFFNIDHTPGQPSCIIFRPDSPKLGERLMYYGTYTVTVKGIKAIDGKDATLTYDTTFFEWDQANNKALPVVEPESSSNSSTPNKPDTSSLSGVSIVFTIGQTSYTVNNEKRTSEAPPYISSDGRTMVPIRFIAEALGANASWQSNTQTSVIEYSGKTISIVLGKALPNDMGTAALVNDRLFVPVRYVSEQLGAKVEWDAIARRVTITK
jgi:hypothetical protein